LAAGLELFLGDLPGRVDDTAFEGVDVVVHCAYMSRHTTLDEARAVNEDGTARVLAASRKHGVGRFVFISSTGAHPEARSYYGRSKLLIEGSLDLERDLVIRPGLILGPGGLFERVRASLASVGVVPVFEGGRQRIQTVHVEDLGRAIEKAIDDDRTGRFVVAEPEGIELRELFKAIARRMGRRCVLVPLPAGPVLFALRAFEGLGVRLPLTSENVLGALSLRTQPSAADLEALGVRLRGTQRSLDDLLAG
jgi:NADH dehydrogenase